MRHLTPSLTTCITAVLIALLVQDPWALARGLVRGLDRLLMMRESSDVVVTGLTGQKIKIRRHTETGLVQVLADNAEDTIFGQGYVTAMERMFQIELLKRLHRGTLAEILGEKALVIDKWHRTMGFYEKAKKDNDHWMATSNKTAEMLQAYADGVNAYTRQRKGLLNVPLEMVLLGLTETDDITTTDVIAFMRYIASVLNKGWMNEVVYARMRAVLPEEVIDAITVGISYDANNIGGGMGTILDKVGEWNGPKEWDWVATDPIIPGMTEGGGSNSWVVSGNFTDSGKPVLSGDPHLPFNLPSPWFTIRLTSPGLDVVGSNIPLCPSMIMARTDKIAFSCTLARADVDDLWYEKIDEEQLKYLDSDGQWRDLEAHSSVIHVKGGEPVPFTFYSTRRGPLVHDQLGFKKPMSLSLLAGQDPKEHDDSTMWAMRRLALAENFTEFRDAAYHVSLASLSLTYADSEGNIGYVVTGRVPEKVDLGDAIRTGWDPEHQYKGWVPLRDMPNSLNPEKGYIISANNAPWNDENTSHAFLGNNWQHGWRASRIAELIEEEKANGSKITPQMMQDWQRDVVSIPGREFARVVRGWGLEGATPQVAAAIKLVEEWDAEMRHDSAAALIYTVVKDTSLRMALRDGGNVSDPLLLDEIMGIGMMHIGKLTNDMEGRHSAFFLRLLEDHPGVSVLLSRLGKTPRELVSSAFEEACVRLEEETRRADPATWRWGELHTSGYGHSLARGGWALEKIFNIQPQEVGGDVDTVALAAFLNQEAERPGLPRPSPRFQQRGFAASLRGIFDMGDADNFWFALAPGISGRLGSQYLDNSRDILRWEDKSAHHVNVEKGWGGFEVTLLARDEP